MIISDPSPRPSNETLSDTERELLSAAVTGAQLDLRTGDQELDDPARGTSWGVRRQVRAEVLVEMLTGTRRLDGRAPRSVELCGARVTGFLDLEATAIICPLRLTDCHIDEPVSLDDATAPAIRMPGCWLITLTARQLRTAGDLTLNDGFTSVGGIRLLGAHIGGQLILSGAHLTNNAGPALTADGLTVDQDMVCGDEFTATGEVRLVGAHIGGQLILSGAHLTNNVGSALTADGLTVGQIMFCGDKFRAEGGVRLIAAHISAQLTLTGATLVNSDGPALDAASLTVDRHMFCDAEGMATGDGRFTATGEVRLARARIGGILSFNGASLTGRNGPALNAERLTVGDTVFCKDNFEATGEVRLRGARIGGQLILNGASLENAGGLALNADDLTVDQSMYCDDGFTATGQVRLGGAHIGAELSLTGARLTNPDAVALYADDLTVNQSMLCNAEDMKTGDGKFTAAGEVRMRGARIGVQLNMCWASLANINANGVALDLQTANISELMLLPERPDGAVYLTNATVGTFDDTPASWPTVLHLRGFVYDSLENRDITVRDRLRWLGLHPGGYTPQLYDQLASAYRRAGDDLAARKVAVAKQRHRRRAFSPLNWLWYATVGYGYRPWLAGVWLAALVVLGTWVFRGAYPAHMIATRTQPPAFHPVAYAFDLLVPVIELGQKSAWQPKSSALLYWSWALTGAGWVLTTAVVAGLTGILKRD